MSLRNIVAELKRLAPPGVEIMARDNGHIQIRGPLLVNYYPQSKRRAAYVAGMNSGTWPVTPKEAIDLALSVPKGDAPEKNRPQLTKYKERMMRRNPHCHWCGRRVFDARVDQCAPEIAATVDHKIPRSLGGLDNPNNYVLACHECNQKRGNGMPELEK